MNNVHLELDLSEEGYRRLAAIAEAMAKPIPAFCLGDALMLVIEAGTSAVEGQLAAKKAGILLPN